MTTDTSYALTVMSEAHAMEISEWSYDPPYHIYNFPAWEDMKKDGIEFGDSVLRMEQYGAVTDGAGRLSGYVQWFPMLGVTRLGLGLRPDLCGRGTGRRLARLAAEEALRRMPGNEIDLEVLAWNHRAIRAYEKAGFSITDTYSRPLPGGGEGLCHCMVFSPADPDCPQTE